MIPAPEISPVTGLILGTKDSVFSFQPRAKGDVDLWEAIALPPGLAIDPVTGEITGTPTESDVFSVTLKATNYESRTFTADAGADTISVPGNGLEDLDQVLVESDDTLPAPLLENEDYEVRDHAGDVMALASREGGDPINITTAGTGTHTIKKPQIDTLLIAIGIFDVVNEEPEPDDIIVDVDIDIVTGEVTFADIPDGFDFGPPSTLTLDGEELPWSVKYRMKKSDRRKFAIGYKRNGVLQEVALGALRIGAKEFEPEQLVMLADGFTQAGEGKSTRFRTVVSISPKAWLGILSNYENDYGTFVDAVTEIEGTIYPDGDGSYDQTEEESLILSSGSVDVYNHNFPALPQIAGGGAALRLSISLEVDGRAAQNTSLSRTFQTVWNGATFVLSDFTGEASSEGADESGAYHWRTSLTVLSVTASSDDIVVQTRVAASEIGPVDAFVLDLPVNGNVLITAGGLLEFVQGDEMDWTLGDEQSATTETLTILQGWTPAQLETAINGMAAPFANQCLGVHFDTVEQKIVILLATLGGSGGTELGNLQYLDPELSSEAQIFPREVYSGDEHDGDLSVRLELMEVNDYERITSETFMLRVESDLLSN